MNSIELNIMKGMVSVLNHDAKIYRETSMHIMSPEQFSMRMNDLKQFEEETGFMFVSSPNCESDLKSIIEVVEIENNELTECDNIEEIVKLSNQKELVVYADIIGIEMTVTYVDGIISNIQTGNLSDELLDMINNVGLPYRVQKDGVYTVKGKIVSSYDNPVFYVHDVVGSGNNYNNNLKEVTDFGFERVQSWTAFNLNPKNAQKTIDYVFEYMQEEVPCSGIVFKLNDIEYRNMMSVMSPNFYDGIIIRRKEE